MKSLKVVLAALACSLFWACSQTVSGSDNDSQSDDALSSVPGYHPAEDRNSANGGKANQGSSSSSAKASNPESSSDIYPDDDWGDDDWGDDWGDDSGSTSPASSGLNVTKFVPDEKVDCTFSKDDDTWQFEMAEADTLIDVTIKFKDNGDLWLGVTTEGETESEEECQQSAALLTVIGAMAAASEETDMVVFAECEGSVFKMTMQGTADEKYTPESRSEMYERVCK